MHRLVRNPGHAPSIAYGEAVARRDTLDRGFDDSERRPVLGEFRDCRLREGASGETREVFRVNLVQGGYRARLSLHRRYLSITAPDPSAHFSSSESLRPLRRGVLRSPREGG